MEKKKIVDIFNSLGIPWWDEGKNVTKGWININCPYCADPSNHCGVNPDTEVVSCWRCGPKGSFVDLLVTVTGLSYPQCKDMISEPIILDGDPVEILKAIFAGEQREKTPKEITEVELPREIELITENTNFPLLYRYIKRRRLSINTLIEHGCGICRSGRYMNRMIIPVFCHRKLVAFQAADLTGFANLKYKNSSGDIGNYLYNYDHIGKVMIVVEGILDAWRVGDEAVAAFTSNLTDQQKTLILKKGLKELYMCFDCELKAYYKARKEAEALMAYIPVVEVIKLPHDRDPDEMGREKIYELINEYRHGLL